MSYNIHHGEGQDNKIDLLRIAELIKREGAQVVALQEVDRGVERTARRDFPAELAELTGMTCVFSNNFHFQGGEYGNAVLTKFPVVRATNTLFRMLRPGEQRGLLQVVLQVQQQELVFMGTHIDHRQEDSERLLNAAEIQGIIKLYGRRPIILCGDFNDVPASRTHTKLKEVFNDTWELIGQGDGFTFPSNGPRKRIDYIWFSKGSALDPRKIWVPVSEASDHLPLAAEFQFR
jgi:endonuclease/exonuclease/phosphatase family metal-dependent hydrolase